MGKIRGTHTSPGVFTKITDIPYSVETAGITNAGLVGETLKGPAFEPIEVKDWEDFVTKFGGKSAELFPKSQYPKYELPYIAESYLKASDQLKVCRVLGLSGYNAGPAFVITATDSANTKQYPVVVLRSKGSYDSTGAQNVCDPDANVDSLKFDVASVSLEKYTNVTSVRQNCNNVLGSGETDYSVDLMNFGRFTIVAKDSGNTEIERYAVSLNPGDKDYIYNVLGSNANEGSAKLFVEELYDYYLQDLIQNANVDKINSAVTTIAELKITPVTDAVKDVLTIKEENLTRKNLGQTFVAQDSGFTWRTSGETSGVTSVGYIYKVDSKLDSKGKQIFYYAKDTDSAETQYKVGEISGDTVNAIYVLSAERFAYLSGSTLVYTSDWTDYKEQFRCASTPWFVSEIKGLVKTDSGYTASVNKLFRFHTISDGNGANTEVKVSIANVDPEKGTFDVYVRDFFDSDGNPTVLESYRGVNMIPGDAKYIALQIGTIDGAYELKSNYIMAEVIESDVNVGSVPCGFLGYPTRYYNGLESPSFSYNVYFDDNIKSRRQYFGLSDITGVDVDMLSYKGVNAYTEDYNNGYTPSFHLDSTISLEGTVVKVDGDVVEKWVTVNVNNGNTAPVIGTKAEMAGSIYEDKANRKFTACFYGGFDGWDIYRTARTTSDDFRANKYKGLVSESPNVPFMKIKDGTGLALEGNCITSDYYAFLAGINQFENPERYEINLFATPGIDYVNNTLLVDDAFEMVENRADSLYVPTTPDKPYGASDDIDEMYSASDAAENLDDAGIDSYYGATYYPWVKFFDKDNNRYINLPPTKDALRIMANVDNKKYPWITPAGFERGKVECERMHTYSKLEDRDEAYDGRINPLMSFSKDGVRIWGNKTMYSNDTPMNRINTVRLVLYMRKLISRAGLENVFDGADDVADNLDRDIRSILGDIKRDRGIYDFRLKISQTDEQKDQHEFGVKLWVKPTPVVEFIEIEFVVTPMGVSFEEIM